MTNPREMDDHTVPQSSSRLADPCLEHARRRFAQAAFEAASWSCPRVIFASALLMHQSGTALSRRADSSRFISGRNSLSHSDDDLWDAFSAACRNLSPRLMYSASSRVDWSTRPSILNDV